MPRRKFHCKRWLRRCDLRSKKEHVTVFCCRKAALVNAVELKDFEAAPAESRCAACSREVERLRGVSVKLEKLVSVTFNYGGFMKIQSCVNVVSIWIISSPKHDTIRFITDLPHPNSVSTPLFMEATVASGTAKVWCAQHYPKIVPLVLCRLPEHTNGRPTQRDFNAKKFNGPMEKSRNTQKGHTR